ncbi:hypothetical protein F66182_11119, partial [Fusarium sp. NRRL 66182]
MSRDDYTPRGLSDPESHLDIAGQRQRPQFDAGTGSEPVTLSSNQQGRHITLNATLEVAMLRHKLRALENLVERYRIPSRTPSLSEAEEARALQYRCECLEAACKQHRCYRGSVTSLVGVLLQGPFAWSQPQTPITPSNPRRGSINDLILAQNSTLSAVTRPTWRLDFQDTFWWQDGEPGLNERMNQPLGPGFHEQGAAPPVLQLIASSSIFRGAAFDLLELLSVSGQLSMSREEEQTTHPALFRAKQLLREIIFYDASQPSPVLRNETSFPPRTPIDSRHSTERNHLLRDCARNYITSLDFATSNLSTMDVRHWLGVFISLCIFSAVETILIDIARSFQGNDPLQPSPTSTERPDQVIRSVYQVLVSLFGASNDPLSHSSEPEDPVVRNIARVIRRDRWPPRQPFSSFDFLLKLGAGEIPNYGFNGFVAGRQYLGLGGPRGVPIAQPDTAPGPS